MSDPQRQDDDIQQKDDTKQESQGGQDSGNSGIHKYFGKSTKPIKLLTSKLRKPLRLPNNQIITVLTQTNITGQKDLAAAPQKTKLKLEYKWSSDLLGAKPKIKLTLNPFNKAKLFQEVMMNWKTTIDRMNEENADIKVNDKKQLNLKYKRTRFAMEKRLRHKLELETNVELDGNVKNAVSFETMLKTPLFDDYKYLNSSQVKGKVAIKDINYRVMNPTFKFDFSEKLTFIVNQYRAKHEGKVAMSFGPKESIEVKSNLQVTNPSNTWTLYGSVTGYKWGLAFDQTKLLYSPPSTPWKIGCMLSQKNGWQVMLQNPKLNKGWWNSVALHVGSKNWVLGMKARGNRKGVGKVNVELTVQSPVRNVQVGRVGVGVVVNVNL